MLFLKLRNRLSTLEATVEKQETKINLLEDKLRLSEKYVSKNTKRLGSISVLIKAKPQRKFKDGELVNGTPRLTAILEIATIFAKKSKRPILKRNAVGTVIKGEYSPKEFCWFYTIEFETGFNKLREDEVTRHIAT